MASGSKIALVTGSSKGIVQLQLLIAFFLILLNISTIEILTADIPVLNGNAPFPSSVIGFIHS